MKSLAITAFTIGILYTSNIQAQQIKADSPEHLAKSIYESAVEINQVPDNVMAKPYLEKKVIRKDQKGKEGYSVEPYTSEEIKSIRCGAEKRFKTGSVTYCYANKGKTMNFMMLFASKGLDKSISSPQDVTILFHDEDANSITTDDFIRTVVYEPQRKLGHTLTNQDGVRFNWDITDCSGKNTFIGSDSYTLANTALFFGRGYIHGEALKKYLARLGKSSTQPDLSETVRATITRTLEEFNADYEKYARIPGIHNCLQ